MKYLLTFLFSILFIPSLVFAQASSNFWKLNTGSLFPVNPTWGITIPSLANLTCIGTNGSGVFGAGTCGVGGGSWPFTTGLTNFGTSTQSTTTPEWFLQGLYASSTSQFLNASTTAFTATTICLTGDTCRTTWPSGGSSASTTLLSDNNTFSGANIFGPNNTTFTGNLLSNEIERTTSGDLFILSDAGKITMQEGPNYWNATFDSTGFSGNHTFTLNDWSGTINAATSSFMSGFFVATSTIASQFPLASTTGLTNTGSTWLTSLGTPAGTILAVDPTGKIIATTTSTGGVASVTGVFPIKSTGGTNPSISSAFSTTTDTGMARNAVVLVGSSGSFYDVASSSLNLPNAALQNSTIGATSPNSTLTFGAAAALGSTFTGDINLGNGNVWTAASTTFTQHLSLNNASSTLFSSPTIWNSTVGNALWLGDTNGKATAYAGTTCTNQALTALSGTGGGTCGTFLQTLGNYASTTGSNISFSTSTVTVNGLTYGLTIGATANALNFTPTITGTYNGPAGSVANSLSNDAATLSGSSFNGSAAVSNWAINLNNSNQWTASTTFTKVLNLQGASSSMLTATTLCLTGDICRTTWPTGGSTIWPFTTGLTNFGTTTQATTTPEWFKLGLYASSTSQFVNASTSLLTVGSTEFIGPSSSIGDNGSQASILVQHGNSGMDAFVQDNSTLLQLFDGGTGGEVDINPSTSNNTLQMSSGSSHFLQFDPSALTTNRQLHWSDLSGSPTLGNYTTGYAGGSIPFGSSGLLATSSNLIWTSSTNNLFAAYSSSTALTATTICLTGDTCRTTWPSGVGSGLSTSSPLSAGNLLEYNSTGPGSAFGIATTTISFSGPFSGVSSLGALVGGSNSTVNWTGLATTTQPTSSNVLVSNGSAGVYGVATSSLGVTGPITFSGTPGAQISGTGGNFGCATCNVYGWPWNTLTNWATTTDSTTTALTASAFFASSTLASQFPYASSTNISVTTLCLTGDTCRTTWPTGGSGVWPFTTTDTNFGQAVQSTTTPEWFKGNGIWGLFASSTSVFDNASSTLSQSNRYFAANGSAPSPAYSFSGTANMGIFNNGGSLTFAVGGGIVASVNTNTFGVVGSGGIVNSHGTASAPTYTFSSNTADGMWNPSDGSLAFSTDSGSFTGAERARFSGPLFALGTTTPFWELTVASSTGPQLALADGSNSSYAWTLRSINNNLFLATSTPTATSTVSAFSINANGLVTVNTASTTNLFGAGLSSCNGGTNALTWNNGVFGCNSISGGSGAWPWTSATNFGTTTNATTTGEWFQQGMYASSTSQFDNANIWNALQIGTSTLPVGLALSNTSAVVGAELNVATTTSISIGMSSSTQMLIRYGTAATTITMSSYHVYAGGHSEVITCNPSAAAGGAITWSGVHFSGGVQPSNSTQAGTCDAWYFDATNWQLGSTSPVVFLSGMVSGVQ